MTKRNTMTEEILRLLKLHGGMSASALVPLAIWSRSSVKDSIGRLRKQGAIYIASYQREYERGCGQPIPVYAAGRLPDATKPAPVRVYKAPSKTTASRVTATRDPTIRASMGVWGGLL